MHDLSQVRGSCPAVSLVLSNDFERLEGHADAVKLCVESETDELTGEKVEKKLAWGSSSENLPFQNKRSKGLLHQKRSKKRCLRNLVHLQLRQFHV